MTTIGTMYRDGNSGGRGSVNDARHAVAQGRVSTRFERPSTARHQARRGGRSSVAWQKTPVVCSGTSRRFRAAAGLYSSRDAVLQAVQASRCSGLQVKLPLSFSPLAAGQWLRDHHADDIALPRRICPATPPPTSTCFSCCLRLLA